MKKHFKITEKDYYDYAPSQYNKTGDIWVGLPTYGLLKLSNITGLVITPSCDLANDKVETITYLPIIPIHTYLSTIAFMPEIIKEIFRLLDILKIKYDVLTTNRFCLMDKKLSNQIREDIHEKLKGYKCDSKEYDYCVRILSGCEMVHNILKDNTDTADKKLYQKLFGVKKYNEILVNIITNAYKADIHFLPADNQRPEWPGVKVHSVVLFRYPITVPIDLFTYAQDVSISDWRTVVENISTIYPSAKAFYGTRPMNCLTLRQIFLHDLLTRYISMYMRLGSPDFMADTVNKYVEEI